MSRYYRDDRTSNKITDNWYHVKDVNESYYTPFVSGKRRKFYSGDGSVKPTPKEVVDITSNEEKEFYYEYAGGFFVEKLYEPGLDAITLPDGVYIYRESSYDGRLPERLTPYHLREDKIVPFKSLFDPIKQDVENFLNNKEVYTKHEMMYKMGLLMYGSPGGGKTISIRRLIKELFSENAVVIFFNSKLPELELMDKLKETLDGRLKIFIFEELVAGLKDWDVEHALNFFDGEQTMGDSIIIATTNFPEALPKNISDRPSRFDKLYNFEKIAPEEARDYIASLLGKPPGEVDLKNAADLSIASLKEACLVCLLRGIPLSESLKEQKERSKLCNKQFAKATSAGFSAFD